MNADEILDSYVSDVVRHLPSRQRLDVALELKSLLAEDLAGDGTGSTVEQIRDRLRAFGRPADVAARYGPPVTIVDPADARLFLRVSAIGIAIIWVVGLVMLAPEADTLTKAEVAQRWWSGAGLGAFWWLGFLVVCFAAAAWVRRRWPSVGQWKPRPVDRDHVSRVRYGLAVLGALAGLVILADPRRWLEALLGDRASAQTYAAFAYDPTFARLLGPTVLIVLGLDIALLIALLIRGRWRPMTRRIDLGLTVVTCALLTWILVAGKVFQAKPTDQVVRLTVFVIVVTALISAARKLRAVRLRSALTPPTGRPAVH